MRTNTDCDECRDKVSANVQDEKNGTTTYPEKCKSLRVIAEDIKARSACSTKDNDGDERRDKVSTEFQEKGHGMTKYPKKCKSFRVTAEDIEKLSLLDAAIAIFVFRRLSFSLR